MYLTNLYKDQLKQISFMNDEEFLAFEIKNLHNLFIDQMIAIKNDKLEYIAVSDEFANEFDLDSSVLGEQTLPQDLGQEILEQEKIILSQMTYQDSMYFYKKDDKPCYCIIRKRQLINPFTNSPVGLFISVMKFPPGFWRKYFIQKITPSTLNNNQMKPQAKLTQQQQQIAFGLLLGFHSRQDIAQLLSNIMEGEFSEIKIKNGINALYQKLECNSLSQLLKLVSQEDMDWGMLPINISGNFPFNQKY